MDRLSRPTPDLSLRRATQSLRRRDERADSGEFQSDLMYRASDTYVSGAQDLW